MGTTDGTTHPSADGIASKDGAGGSIHRGRVVIVTGAFGALGGTLAPLLRERGWRTALLDRGAAPPSLVAAATGRHDDNILLLGGVDLCDEMAAASAVARIHERFGRIDALANIAGGFAWETIGAGETRVWETMFSMNVLSCLHATRASVPYLLRQSDASVVNVGAAASSRAVIGMGAYAAAKSGVQRLTEALADEFKDAGLRANAVLPAVIDTPANRIAMPDADFSKWVSPLALAEVIAFLLSPAASAVTGAAIPVTGRM